MQPIFHTITGNGETIPAVSTRDFAKPVQRGGPYGTVSGFLQCRNGIVGQSVGFSQTNARGTFGVHDQDAVFRAEPFCPVPGFEHAEIFGVRRIPSFEHLRCPQAVFFGVVIKDAAVAKGGKRMPVQRMEGMHHLVAGSLGMLFREHPGHFPRARVEVSYAFGHAGIKSSVPVFEQAP